MAQENVDRKTLWAGRVASALPVLAMLMSGVFKLRGGPEMAKNWAASGYGAGTLVPIGLTEIACAVLYVIPGTSVLGAVLVTGYLGGAVSTHVRNGDGFFWAPALFGALAWLGLYLRDPRLRALLPFRRDP